MRRMAWVRDALRAEVGAKFRREACELGTSEDCSRGLAAGLADMLVVARRPNQVEEVGKLRFYGGRRSPSVFTATWTV